MELFTPGGIAKTKHASARPLFSSAKPKDFSLYSIDSIYSRDRVRTKSLRFYVWENGNQKAKRWLWYMLARLGQSSLSQREMGIGIQESKKIHKDSPNATQMKDPPSQNACRYIQRSQSRRLLQTFPGLKLLQQVLVEDQHGPALDTGPHTARTNAAEPPREPLRAVDHSEPREYGGCIQPWGTRGWHRRRRRRCRDGPRGWARRGLG